MRTSTHGAPLKYSSFTSMRIRHLRLDSAEQARLGTETERGRGGRGGREEQGERQRKAKIV